MNKDDKKEAFSKAIVNDDKIAIEKVSSENLSIVKQNFPELSDSQIYTAFLGTALDHNALECAKFFIEQGANVNVHKDPVMEYKIDHGSLLHESLYENKNPLISLMLIEAGADLTVISNDGNTPLHYAVQYNSSIDVIAAIVQKGADINARNMKKQTPARCSEIPKELVEDLFNAVLFMKEKNIPLKSFGEKLSLQPLIRSYYELKDKFEKEDVIKKEEMKIKQKESYAHKVSILRRKKPKKSLFKFRKP